MLVWPDLRQPTRSGSGSLPDRCRRRADIDDLRLGDRTVWHDRKIPPPGQDVRRTPVHFDDATVRSPVDTDPVAGPIGPAKAQHNAGKHVPERALECETENDRNS